ncbi:lipopolysaccharide biosynthesis protein [Sphingomonas rubra]|uniref:Membrane protein involved in the export of O-antigen and teichoic acid n=1 Tax=Sphingomonas rubra TaxID=634430 RepID=A0A1I5S918_9SPHN|nr:lipopolysaccharide biosynthesis protein [Sphingomonas rubra]SFP67244.1 Membrane protein involved in the export of O-antigen and teichoic acid [Sphingomonas rubra]
MTTPAPSPSPGIMRAAARNLGWLLASRSVLAVLSLFYLGIITRSLGVTGFGRFALITGASQTLATLVAFQSWQVIVQYGVAPQERGDDAALGRLFRASALVDAGGAAVGALLAWAILEIWGEALGIGETLKRATLIFSIVQLVTIRSTPLGILRLRDKFSLSAIADSVTPVARFVGAIGVWLVHPTVQGFLVAWGAAEVLTAATYWVMLWRRGDLRLLRQGKGMRRLIEENPGIVRFALSTNASSTLGLSGKQLPLLIVGAGVGPAAAGVFRLASQIAQALAKLSQLISRAAFPEVVKMVKAASTAQLGRMLSRLFMGSGVAAVAIMALVAVAGRPVLSLVGGREFRDAWPVLLWLAIAGCLDLATVGVDTVLTALQRAGTVFALRLVGIVILFAAAAALIPPYGTVGVAMAVAAGSAVVALLMGVAALRLARHGLPQ